MQAVAWKRQFKIHTCCKCGNKCHQSTTRATRELCFWIQSLSQYTVLPSNVTAERYRKLQVNESFRWTDSKDSSHRDESKSPPLFNTDRRALDYGCARQAPVNALSSPLPQSIAQQQQQQSARYTVGRMDGAGSFGAGRAGSAFDLLAFVKQPQTILRVLAWVRTAVFYELWLEDYALPFMFRF